MAGKSELCLCSLYFLFVFIIASNAKVFSRIILQHDVANAFYSREDPDISRNATELITSKGYPAEDHTVQTEDGFLLDIQRIPHGRGPHSRAKRRVVFLQHGLLSSSTCWIVNSASESLAFILADAGYDVWLGNVRGNTYSRKHISLHPDQPEFWAWSWDQMVRYDLPAMLKYTLNVTDEDELYYIGHSQGTLIAMTQFSQDPQLTKKIKLFIGLGPVATVGDITTPFRYLAYISSSLQDLFDLFGIEDFLPNSEIIKILGASVCKEVVVREICENILFLFAGEDATNLNITRLPVYVAHAPAGTSVQNMVHFAQMVKSGKCEMYDYGSKARNMKHYHQPMPPLYDLTQMKVPSYLFSSQKDTLADPQDVKKLLSMLPNIVYHEQIAHWNHLDFIWATDANTVLYKRILHILSSNPIV